MSRKWAIITLSIVVVVFLLGLTDLTVVDPPDNSLAERVVSLTAVILSGVAVGSILGGLRRNGGTARVNDDAGGDE